MIKKSALFLVVVLACMVAGGGNAASLAVDTGVPIASNPAQPLMDALSLDGNNWLAGQVNFTSGVKIYAINYWLNDNNSGGGTYTVALYTDSSNLPGTLVASASGIFDAVDSGVSGWHGAANLGWWVNPGTYWTAFEVGSTDTFGGLAPISAPFPLARYAFNDGSFAGYVLTNAAFGVQVALPEPPTFWLLMPVLVGMVCFRKRAAF